MTKTNMYVKTAATILSFCVDMNSLQTLTVTCLADSEDAMTLLKALQSADQTLQIGEDTYSFTVKAVKNCNGNQVTFVFSNDKEIIVSIYDNNVICGSTLKQRGNDIVSKIKQRAEKLRDVAGDKVDDLRGCLA